MPLPKTNKKSRLGVIACGEPILATENIEECNNPSAFVLCICTRHQPQVDNGEIAACLVDGEFETKVTLKRFYKYDDKIILQAENPAYPPLVYVNEEMNRVRVIGKAVGFTSKL